MLKRILELPEFSRILRPLFRVLDFLWPKDRGLIVFTGGRHAPYADNSRYLFEKFLEEYSDEFDICWITPARELLTDSEIEENIRNYMVYQYSINGLVTLLRARTVFFSWGFSDLPGTDFSKRTIMIQLWHGIPIKGIGRLNKRPSKKASTSMIRKWSRFAYWISSSAVDRNSIALCTELPMEKVKITGYPRNDHLIDHRNSRDSRLLDRFPFLDKTVILYAPTWRPDNRVEFFPFDDFRMDELASFLEENDSYLILRGHLVDDVLALNGTLDFNSFESNRVVVLNRDKVRDVQDILPYVDVLISDYSGIWVDFLLLDRPIIFVPYDLESYEKNEGLLYDYSEITPGPKVLKFYEFLDALRNYIVNPRHDSVARCRIKRVFHEFEDGMAYSRIRLLIMDELSQVTAAENKQS